MRMHRSDEMVVCDFLARKMLGQATEEDRTVSQLSAILRVSSDFVVRMIHIRTGEILVRRREKKALQVLHR